MTIQVQWQDQFGRWHHYQTKQNQADAYRVAQRRAESTGKRQDHYLEIQVREWIWRDGYINCLLRHKQEEWWRN